MTCGSGRPNWRPKVRNADALSSCPRNTRTWARKKASQISLKETLMASASRPKLPSGLNSINNYGRCPESRFELRHVEPLLLTPALVAELGELHALGAFEQAPAKRALAGDVPEEELPLRLEGVVVVVVRNFFPAGEEVDWL